MASAAPPRRRKVPGFQQTNAIFFSFDFNREAHRYDDLVRKCCPGR